MAVRETASNVNVDLIRRSTRSGNRTRRTPRGSAF
jgi:hypothetical protein